MPTTSLGSPRDLSLELIPDSDAVSNVSRFTIYVTYYDPFDIYIAILNHSPHHPPPIQQEWPRLFTWFILCLKVCILSII